jgi:hypothetical protein
MNPEKYVYQTSFPLLIDTRSVREASGTRPETGVRRVRKVWGGDMSSAQAPAAATTPFPPRHRHPRPTRRREDHVRLRP